MRNNKFLKAVAFLTAAILLMLVVSGCFGGKAKPKVEADVNANQPTPPSEEANTGVGIDVNANANIAGGVVLYDYGKVGSYEYRMTTTSSGQTTTSNIKYTVSSGTYEGQSAWVLSSEITIEGATGKVNVYTDKETGRCIISETEMIVLSQTVKSAAKCDIASDVKTNAQGKAAVQAQGTETVTVPAGTLTTTKYIAENGVSYWVTAGVPIPVKFYASENGVVSVGELVSYS